MKQSAIMSRVLPESTLTRHPTNSAQPCTTTEEEEIYEFQPQVRVAWGDETVTGTPVEA